MQVRGVRLIHEIGSCGIGLVTGRFFVFHGQGVPRFAVARIGSEVMEKGGRFVLFLWVNAVASVFQLISLVGKLSGVLMRYVIRVGPDVFISMGAEVGRWGYLQYNQALVFPVAASALFSHPFVLMRLPFCRITAFMFPMQTAVSVFVGRHHCSVSMCSCVMVSDDILSSPDIVKSTMLFSFQKISKIHQISQGG